MVGSVRNNVALEQNLKGQLLGASGAAGLSANYLTPFMRKGALDVDDLAKGLGQISANNPVLASQIFAELAPQFQKLTAVEQGTFERLLKTEIGGGDYRALDIANNRAPGRSNASADGNRAGYVRRPMSVQEAQNIVRLQNLNPNAPIYIGGGGDGYFNSNVKAYAKRPGTTGNFFTHNRSGSIQNAIEAFHTLGRPVIIVGHSWGGEEALDAARFAIRRDIPVALLVTIDPVNGSGSNSSIAGMRNMRENLSGLWVNVRATGYQTNHDGFDGDRWADLGGRMPSSHQQQADVYIESNRNHGDFRGMMRDANIATMIQSIYSQER
jgi:hypothetical protein